MGCAASQAIATNLPINEGRSRDGNLKERENANTTSVCITKEQNVDAVERTSDENIEEDNRKENAKAEEEIINHENDLTCNNQTDVGINGDVSEETTLRDKDKTNNTPNCEDISSNREDSETISDETKPEENEDDFKAQYRDRGVTEMERGFKENTTGDNEDGEDTKENVARDGQLDENDAYETGKASSEEENEDTFAAGTPTTSSKATKESSVVVEPCRSERKSDNESRVASSDAIPNRTADNKEDSNTADDKTENGDATDNEQSKSNDTTEDSQSREHVESHVLLGIDQGKSVPKSETDNQINEEEVRKKKELIEQLIEYLENPDVINSFEFNDNSQIETERQSLLSTSTDKSLIFPEPELDDKTQEAPSRPKTIAIEDTFWQGKKKLIPDYSIMEAIDKHVLKAEESLKEDPAKLVEYLLEPCKSEVEKARAVTRWIGENVAYDSHFLQTGVRGEQTIEAVLKTGRAVCDGYGTVFEHLAGLADLECNKLSGQAKGAGYFPGCFDPHNLSAGPGAHAWNAVKIDGQWHFVDSTWAAGASEGANFLKRWNESWFLADPDYFMSHIPLERNTVIQDQQHMKDPITDPKTWTDTPLVTPQGGVYGIKPLTHTHAVIESEAAEIIIQYACKYHIRQFLSVQKHKRAGYAPANTKSDFKDMVFLFSLDGRSSIFGRFYEPGTYHVSVWETFKDQHPALAVSTNLLAYSITVRQRSNFRLVKGLDGFWGMTPEL